MRRAHAASLLQLSSRQKFLDYYREAVTDTRQQALVACERDLH
jgi:hypothetical protein